MTLHGSWHPEAEYPEPPILREHLQRPNIARAWNFAGNGKDNFARDRDVLHGMENKQFPFVLPWMARANHQFLLRALAYLATKQRMTQFLLLGVGIPADDTYPHETVQRFNPTAKVAYVDNDPVVLAHARRHDRGPGQQKVVDADIFDPKSLLADKEVTTFLDFSQPIAIICTAVLHYHPGDTDDVTAMMQAYIDAVPAASCTVITHFLDFDTDGWNMRNFEDALGLVLDTPVRCRTLEKIERLFPDQDLLAPGVVPCLHWPYEDANEPPMIQTAIAGGIGKKKAPST